MKIVTAPVEDFLHDAYAAIGEALEGGQKVVLFISGGSAIPVEIDLLKKLYDFVPTDELTVLPVDERYGDAGHSDSNIAQLKKGLGQTAKELNIVDILDSSKAFEQAAMNFAGEVEKAFDDNDATFAILGLGEDGHTAGIIPGSPADTSDNHVEFYVSETFRRITLTEQALCNIDHVFVYVYGFNKYAVIKDLADGKTGRPMDMFRYFPDVTLYTDNNLG